MGKLRHLRFLRVDRAISNEALAPIEGLVELEYFSGTRGLDNIGLRHLRNMTNMRRLQCGMRRVTDGGLRSIRGLSQRSFKASIVRACNWATPGLVSIGTLKRLVFLNIRGTRVTSAGMKSLTDLTVLRVLDLMGTRVDDEGMVWTAKLPKLQCLEISGTKVSDRGLEKLLGMPALRDVTANQSKVTEKGAILLRQRGLSVRYEWKPEG